MGSYNTAVITTAGQALLTSILANQGTLTFSKFQTSSYQYASGTDLSALTSLNDVEQTVTPSGAGIIDSTTLYATSTVSNSGLAAEYTAYTLGLFISDGVDEVLFAVATAIVPDVIPEDIGGTPSTYTYSLQLGVSSTEDITINVDMDAYLTADSVIDNLTSTSVNSPLSAKQGKLLNDNKANKADISSIITTGTKNTTGSQIASGTYFYLNGQLVKAKSVIAVNDDYTLNTNYEVVTVGGVLTELNSNLGVRSSQAQYNVTDGFTATEDGMLYVHIIPAVATDFIYRFTLSDASEHIFYYTISCHNGNAAGCSTFIRRGYTLNLPADTNVNNSGGVYFRLSVGMYS